MFLLNGTRLFVTIAGVAVAVLGTVREVTRFQNDREDRVFKREERALRRAELAKS